MIYIDSAGCISQKFEASKGHNIATFKWNNEQCTYEVAEIDTRILINKAAISGLTSRIDSLEKENKKLANYNTQLTKQMDAMAAKLEALQKILM